MKLDYLITRFNMKNAIFFPLYIFSEKSTTYHIALYKALETFYNGNGDKGIDVIVYYYIDPKLGINENDLISGDYNLFKDFKKVTFVKFPFTSDGIYKSKFLFKWFALDHLYKNFDFERLLILDADVLFSPKAYKIFEICDDKDCVYALMGSTAPFLKKLLNGDHCNGGQFLLSRDSISKMMPFKNNFLKFQDYLFLRARQFYDIHGSQSNQMHENKDSFNRFAFLSDQYVITLMFKKYKINIVSFNREKGKDKIIDFGHVNELYQDTELKKNYIKFDCLIIHYWNCGIRYLVDKKYRNAIAINFFKNNAPCSKDDIIDKCHKDFSKFDYKDYIEVDRLN